MSLKTKNYNMAEMLSAKQSVRTFTQATVTVTAGAATGTATVPSGSIPIGIVPVSNQDQFVDSVLVASTTLTVTLAANATANNVFVVTLIEAA